MPLRAFVVMLGVFLCAASLGCKQTVRPDPVAQPMDQAAALKLEASGPVAVRNAAPAAGEQELFGIRNIEFRGDLHHYTDVAVTSTRNALAVNHVQVAETAAKTLDLVVTKVDGDDGWVFYFMLTMKVTTGDGLTREYVGKDKASWHISQATPCLENAQIDIIMQMLADPEIKAYLKK